MCASVTSIHDCISSRRGFRMLNRVRKFDDQKPMGPMCWLLNWSCHFMLCLSISALYLLPGLGEAD